MASDGSSEGPHFRAVTQAANGPFNVSLNAGWNGVGLQCYTLTSLSGGSGIAGMATWDGTNYRTASFTTSDVNAGEGTRRGFWVYATAATTFTYSGTSSDGASVSLRAGWNLISCPTSGESLPGSALTCRRGGVTVPLGSVLLPQFYEVGPGGYSIVDIGASGLVRPGKAYWVYALDAVTVSYGSTPGPGPGSSPVAVNPSATDQTVAVMDGLNVTIPGGLLTSPATLSLRPVTAPTPSELFSVRSAYDLTLNYGGPGDVQASALVDLSKPLRVHARVPSTTTAGWFGGLWSRETGWVSVPTSVSEQWLQFQTQWTAIGLCTLEPGHDRLVNSIFFLDYSKAAVDGFSAGWYTASDPLAGPVGSQPDPPNAPIPSGVPTAAKDAWYYLNHAHRAYVSNNLHSLARLSDWYWPWDLASRSWTYAFLEATFTGRRSKLGNLVLGIPNHYNVHRHNVAHELFHAIQSTYFSALRMTTDSWYMDATADYAADRLAWGDLTNPNSAVNGTGKMGGETGAYDRATFLKRPLDDRAAILDDGDQHEYNAAFFFAYLVDERHYGFMDMWNSVANSTRWSATTALEDYCLSKSSSLALDYRRFAEFYLFSASSPIHAMINEAKLTSLAQNADKEVLFAATDTGRNWQVDVGAPQRLTGQLLRVPLPAGSPRALKIALSRGAGLSDVPADTAVAVYAGTPPVNLGLVTSATREITVTVPGGSLYLLVTAGLEVPRAPDVTVSVQAPGPMPSPTPTSTPPLNGTWSVSVRFNTRPTVNFQLTVTSTHQIQFAGGVVVGNLTPGGAVDFTIPAGVLPKNSSGEDVPAHFVGTNSYDPNQINLRHRWSGGYTYDHSMYAPSDPMNYAEPASNSWSGSKQ